MGLFNRKNKRKINESHIEENQKNIEKEYIPTALTLYSIYPDCRDELIQTTKEEFSEVTKYVEDTDDGIRIIFNDGTSLEMHIADNYDYVLRQTVGMSNYFSNAPLQNEQVLKDALLQIKLFTIITGFSFEIDDNEQRTNYITNTIFIIGKKTTSMILTPSMALFTPEFKLLISIDGNTDYEEYIPISTDLIFDRDVEETLADKKRYETIINECKEKNIPYRNARLKTQLYECEVKVPSIEDIAKRAVSIFACAVYSEGLLMEHGSLKKAKKEFEIFNDIYDVSDYLSPNEKRYLNMDIPDQTTAIQFSWQYERCAVLLWALGLIELNKPTEICDVYNISQTLRSYNSIEDLISHCTMKTDSELLEMHTRILYYDWACVDARINKKEMPAGLDKGVVYEQHYALNYLVGANGHCNWDEISPNT